MKRDVLYVDDEADNLVVFEATFEDSFNIWTASSAQQALEMIEERPFPVVVADQRMPGMTGSELFEVMRRRHLHTRRVMLTGYADSQAMIDAINQGHVYYFLKKPWERHDVQSVLVRAIESYELEMSNLTLTDRLVSVDRCAALGQSAARIAHEMGNQLCMLPLLELIEDQYADHEDLVQTASFARQTHERLAQLINEVKAFVRCEQDSITLAPLAMADVIHELRQFIRFDQSLPAAKIHVLVESEPMIRGNKTKLQQVVINLLKNAAHAIGGCEDGCIELRLSADSQSAVLEVTDNGCGMTPEVEQRIWEPFFTTKGQEGTGLGLDISRSMITQHGGQIECRTAPGKGTTFTIRLPLDEECGGDSSHHNTDLFAATSAS
jgi:C4-dicarboxylate-specific signal transduction histidine kinase